MQSSPTTTLWQRSLIILALLVASSGCSPSYYSNSNPPQTVDSVDLTQYQGLWYEIARLPQWFQRNCLASTARYEMLSPTDLSVTNTCYEANGEESSIRGKAWIPNEATPAKLKVRFDSFPASLFTGDYWIIDLKDNYQIAVVSGPSGNSLWILSRSKVLTEDEKKQVIESLKHRGFKVEHLIFDIVERFP